NVLPPSRASASDWVIAEVDESDGTIGRFSPAITLAVNLDWDHADHYATRADIENEFAALFARTKEAVFVSDACVMSQRLTSGALWERACSRQDVESREHARSHKKLYSFGKTGDFEFSVQRETPPAQALKLGGKFGF